MIEFLSKILTRYPSIRLVTCPRMTIIGTLGSAFSVFGTHSSSSSRTGVRDLLKLTRMFSLTRHFLFCCWLLDECRCYMEKVKERWERFLRKWSAHSWPFPVLSLSAEESQRHNRHTSTCDGYPRTLQEAPRCIAVAWQRGAYFIPVFLGYEGMPSRILTERRKRVGGVLEDSFNVLFLFGQINWICVNDMHVK